MYPINQSPLYRLHKKSDLEQLLRLKPGVLRNEVCLDSQYSVFYKKKSSGGKRTVAYPKGKQLIQIQKVLFKYLNRIERPEWVKSGRKGESYITNAAEHVEHLYGMKSDISRFYDSVAYNRIRKFFREEMEMSPDVAEIVTRMVTYKRHLPTGGKASMLIAYFAYEGMFHEIYRAAEEQGIVFTLYVDDLSFSADRRIEAEFFDKIHGIVAKYGLKAKWSKTQFYNNSGYREYTGVGIKDGRMVLPNDRRLDIIDSFKACQENPDNMELLASLNGKLNAARQIEPGAFPQIYGYVKKREDKLKNSGKTK